MTTLSLVIPAYNEERRLPQLLDALASHAAADVSDAGLELLEAVIVDDGSVDRTAELLREAAQRQPIIKAVTEAYPNRGKGAATARGIREAHGELILLADVDLSTPISELITLRARLDAGVDIVIGSRDIAGSVLENTPAHRKQIGRAFNLVVRALSGLPFRDTQCGFKLMSASVARTLVADPLTSGYAFDVELLMKARLAGFSVAEVPVFYRYDEDTRVRLASASVRMLRDVIRLSYRLRGRPSRSRPRPAAARRPE